MTTPLMFWVEWRLPLGTARNGPCDLKQAAALVAEAKEAGESPRILIGNEWWPLEERWVVAKEEP